MLVSNFLRVMSNVLLSYKCVSSKQISLSVLSPVMCTTLKRRQLFMYEDDDRRPHEPNLSRLMKKKHAYSKHTQERHNAFATKSPRSFRFTLVSSLGSSSFFPTQKLDFFGFPWSQKVRTFPPTPRCPQICLRLFGCTVASEIYEELQRRGVDVAQGPVPPTEAQQLLDVFCGSTRRLVGWWFVVQESWVGDDCFLNFTHLIFI